MQTIDWYIFRELSYASLGRLLLVVCVAFFAYSFRFVDTVVEHNGGLALFGELVVFLLPSVFLFTVPLAAFAGTLSALHRLVGDSEVVAIYAAGVGVSRMLRATAVFALVIAVVTGLLAVYLVPLANHNLETRLHVLRNDLSTTLLRDGQFHDPAQGVAVYLRWIDQQGTLYDVFVHDARDPDRVITYSARRAIFEQQEEQGQLTMFDGSIHTLNRNNELRSVLRFDQFVYDLSALLTKTESRNPRPREMLIPELIEASQQAADAKQSRRLRAEVHGQLSAPLYGFALPFVVLLGMLASSTGLRINSWRPIATTFAGVVLVMSAFPAKNLTIAKSTLDWALYAPPSLAVLLTLAFLSGSGIRHVTRVKAIQA